MQAQVTSLPAPTRGIIQSENDAFMQPGAAIVLDNWMPTMQGIRLRGGCEKWCALPEQIPVISSFEYKSGITERMFAANDTKLYEVTYTTPIEVKAGQQSGNYAASQLSNAAGDWLIAVNDAGDFPLRYDGTSWEVMDAAYVPPAGKPSKITVNLTKYPGANVQNGRNLTYVCKYRRRLFFIELNSMNAWYLPLDAVGGELEMIPLSGSATKGGRLLFCATWSIDAGDGIDDKLVFCSDLGELLIFTGSDPGNAANWRQEGRYDVPAPMGMNAHILVGGDLLIATVTGIVPTSASITKDGAQLELAAVTRNIKRMWREHVIAKRNWAWTMKKWDEFGGIFVTVPGGKGPNRMCLAVNDATGAWCRMPGYDATCFLKIGNDLFFGTQDGRIMQADRTGYDDGEYYTATMVGGWGALSTQPAMTVWTQARASFFTKSGEPFLPQLSACTDFVVRIPAAPSAGPDVGVEDVWDQGKWGPAGSGVPPDKVPTPEEKERYAQWGQASTRVTSIKSTMWVSIGTTGYTHAPVVQVTVGQQAKPNVELISIDAIHARGGVNV